MCSSDLREKVLTELPFARHVIVRGPGSDLVFRKIGRFLDRLPEAPSAEPGPDSPTGSARNLRSPDVSGRLADPITIDPERS